MLPPYKIDADPRARTQVFTGRGADGADVGSRDDDPDRRLVEHWQRLFAEKRAGKTGSA